MKIIRILLLHALASVVAFTGPTFNAGARQQADQPAPQKQVRLYFPKEGDSSQPRSNPFNLQSVTRRVNAAAPMRPTLAALLAGPTPAEQAQGFHALDSERLSLTRLTIEAGTAHASFAHRAGSGWAGELSPVTFRAAVERTLKQFPNVRRVIICVDGAKNFDVLDSGQRPRKCQ